MEQKLVKVVIHAQSCVHVILPGEVRYIHTNAGKIFIVNTNLRTSEHDKNSATKEWRKKVH